METQELCQNTPHTALKKPNFVGIHIDNFFEGSLAYYYLCGQAAGFEDWLAGWPAIPRNEKE